MELSLLLYTMAQWFTYFIAKVNKARSTLNDKKEKHLCCSSFFQTSGFSTRKWLDSSVSSSNPKVTLGLKPVLNKSVFSPFEIFIVIFQLIVFHSLQWYIANVCTMKIAEYLLKSLYGPFWVFSELNLAVNPGYTLVTKYYFLWKAISTLLGRGLPPTQLRSCTPEIIGLFGTF